MINVWIIVIISLLGPIIGSVIGVLKKPSDIFMFNMLAFAAGIMLTISFFNLIPQSISYSSGLVCVIGIMFGALLMFLIDKIIPHLHLDAYADSDNAVNMKKTSVYLSIGLFMHNFPEGMVIAIGAISNTQVGIAIALAMAIQKIPEGICTSAPHYYCTKNRLKSFLFSCITIIPLIAGFIFAYYIYTSVPTFIVGIVIGIAAGMMIYISTDELIPTSCHRMTNHSTILSLIAGVLFVVLLNTI
jgi:zinc transporter, ZIP family